jgi:FkbH-like protein
MSNLNDICANVDPDQFLSVVQALKLIEQVDLSEFPKIKIHFLKNYTIEGVEPFLKYQLYLSGITSNFVFGDYNLIRQEILSENSHLYRDPQPDIIVISQILETLDSTFGDVSWTYEEAKLSLEESFDLLRAQSSALVIVSTFLPPFYNEAGIGNLVRNKTTQVRRLNDWILEYCSKHSTQFFAVDLDRIIRILGEENAIDYRQWYLSKAPFKKQFLNLFSLEISKYARALKGKIKKCLVLDCDNTLWGGILGEDGIDGIKLDLYEYPGKIYYEFQQAVLQLIDRGVMVTICSKNNEADVLEALEKHPYQLIKQDQLVGWRINWENKVDNIVSLAAELNIGLDSFVFVDDSPAECGLVNALLPQVTVLQVPEKLYQYPSLIFKDGWFDNLNQSEEDQIRTKSYVQEKQRAQVKFTHNDLESYLRSLNIKIFIKEAKVEDVPRTAQLTQKTNQFNLTTHRYSEKDIHNFMLKDNSEVFVVSVEDRFGSYGLTGVFIAEKNDSLARIDTMLMSCRVLGKEVEFAFASKILNLLTKRWSVTNWRAKYLKTSKNNQVSDFWEKLGFIMESDSGSIKEYCVTSDNLCWVGPDYIQIEP